VTELPVFFSPRSEKQLLSIFRYIALKSSPEIARDYTEAIRLECLTLSQSPNRGKLHHLPTATVRTIGFRRSATIAFRVHDANVLIVGIYYRGRNVVSHL
jgi:toxin ParE1/3/4